VKGKLLFVAGLAIGYVLGTRDGRRRYEQIKSAAQTIWESEPVQWAAAQAQDAMGELGEKALAGARKVVTGSTKSNIDKPAVPPRRATPARAATSSATASPVTKPVPTVEPSARPRKTDTSAE
jgi:hypothetical protein